MNIKNRYTALFRSTAIGVLVLVCTSTLFADEWYVKDDGLDTDLGTSWGSAWATLSNAVNNAAPLDTILVSNGTYGVTAQIVVNKAVSIIGQGAREATIVERVGAQSNRIFNLSDAGCLIANLTIRNGSIAENSNKSGGIGGFSGGGGIYMTGGIVSNCVITVNSNIYGNAYPYGGGVSMSGGTLWGCTVSSNRTDGYGSYGQGVYIIGGTIRDSIVIDNHGRIGEQREGAGIAMMGGTPLVTNTFIARNGGIGGTGVGGVTYHAGTLVDCTIVSNSMPGVRMYGGSTLDNCTLAYNNQADVVLWGKTGDVVTNCVIYGGSAGTGIFFDYYNVNSLARSNLVVDCIISNRAGLGVNCDAYLTDNRVVNGTIYNSAIAIGNNAAANSNQFLVTGSGERWDLNGKNVTVGHASSTGNVMTITNDGTVDNIGTLSVLGTFNSVNLLGGTLGVKTTTYPTAFVAGDGTQDATLKVLGTLTFPSGLTITNNATLGGRGKVVATTKVFGTVSPGISIGAITNSGTLTLTPTATTAIEVATNTQAGAGWDLVVVDTGALELDGELHVALTDGFEPSDTQSFIIMTNTVPTSVSGAFDNTASDQVMVYDGIGGKAVGTFRVAIGTQSVVLDSYAPLPTGTVITIR